MPALANIVINDGLATPVAHTFTPDRIDSGVALWLDRSSGIALGYPSITQSIRAPAKGATNRVNRCVMKVVYPVLEQLSGSTTWTLAYSLEFNCTFLMHERATLQNRKDILAFAKNLLASAFSASAVQDLESAY